MTIDGQSRALHQPLSAMTSTLRLELGAFLSQATGATNAAFTSWDASALLSVQADLERALASGAPDRLSTPFREHLQVCWSPWGSAR